METQTTDKTTIGESQNKQTDQPAVKNGDQPQGRKDSTNDLPMIDLGEAIELVTTIHSKAMEMASMPEVAKACGYTSPSSTPFYRRASSARLFRLLSPQKAELTSQALDFLKPPTEEAKQRALEASILAIPAYAELLQRYQGKRVNAEIIANGFARAFSLSDACAGACARAFVASVKFAGLMGLDGTVAPAAMLTSGGTETKAKEPEKPAESRTVEPEYQTCTLMLDAKAKKKFVVQAPFSVSKREYRRLILWLRHQLGVDDVAESDVLELDKAEGAAMGQFDNKISAS